MATLRAAHHRHAAPRRWRRIVTALAAASVIVLVLAACGSSSNSGSTTKSASTSSGASVAGGSRSARFSALRECLKRDGITLPSRKSPGSGGAPGPGGGFTLPEGVSQAKFQEAVKKCGGSGFPGGRRNFSSTALKGALSKYAACMRQNGIDLPAPNTTGAGPVFNTKGLNRSSAAFKTAQQKCKADLPAAFGFRGRPPGGASGTPPAGGEGGPPGGAPPAGEGAPEAGA